MKKILMGIFVVLLAAATAFATPQSRSQRLDDPLLEWFDDDGNYIGQEFYSVMHGLCPYEASVCAKGYGSATVVEGQVVPVGGIVQTVRYPN
jgi:hypothetical protein